MLRLALLLCLAAPLAQAQPAPQPYVRAAAGLGVVSTELDYGAFERVLGTPAAGGSVEVGLRRPSWSVGVEVAALRASGGPEAPSFPVARTEREVGLYASALVMGRSRLAVGPVDIQGGTGIGLSRSVADVRETRRTGVGAGERTTRREVRLQPVLSTEVAIGRETGKTFVGVGATTYIDLRRFDMALRGGLVLQRAF